MVPLEADSGRTPWVRSWSQARGGGGVEEPKGPRTAVGRVVRRTVDLRSQCRVPKENRRERLLTLLTIAKWDPEIT